MRRQRASERGGSDRSRRRRLSELLRRVEVAKALYVDGYWLRVYDSPEASQFLSSVFGA